MKNMPIVKFMRFACIGMISLILLLNTNTYAAALDELKAFPDAEKGMKRIVIELPVKEAERSLMVELIPGKVMMVDGLNRIHLNASIKPESLQGWGYRYYTLVSDGRTLSTMMALPAGSGTMKKAFVQGDSIKIPYNSKLPVVLYAPDGYGVHYRIWTAGSIKNAEQGAQN